MSENFIGRDVGGVVEIVTVGTAQFGGLPLRSNQSLFNLFVCALGLANAEAKRTLTNSIYTLSGDLLSTMTNCGMNLSTIRIFAAVQTEALTKEKGSFRANRGWSLFSKSQWRHIRGELV